MRNMPRRQHTLSRLTPYPLRIESPEASLGHANCEAMERREWMPSFVKIFST
jgi:hypothetical protein